MKIRFYKNNNSLGIIYSCGSYFNKQHILVIDLICISIYIYLPFYVNKSEDEIGCDNYKRYGINFINDGTFSNYKIFNCICIYYGYKIKFIETPWHYTFIYLAVKDKYNNWYIEDVKSRNILRKAGKYFNQKFNSLKLDINDCINNDPIRFYYNYNYKYDILNQESNCKYYIAERCWRPKWLKWTNLFSYKRRVIEVEFENEMGSKAGSWKGGVISCSFDMKFNETPEECIKRMEKEYNF